MVDFLGGLTLSGGLTLTSGSGSSASSAKWIVVGAPYDDDEASDAGVAFVFDATNPSASPTKITANDAAAGDNFGTTVAVCGDMIAVGSPVDGNGTGSVYIFDGTDLSKWKAKWSNKESGWQINDDGSVTVVFDGSGGIETLDSFGSVQLHIEWKTSEDISHKNQSRDFDFCVICLHLSSIQYVIVQNQNYLRFLFHRIHQILQ